jgi:hypothetical protein
MSRVSTQLQQKFAIQVITDGVSKSTSNGKRIRRKENKVLLTDKYPRHIRQTSACVNEDVSCDYVIRYSQQLIALQENLLQL